MTLSDMVQLLTIASVICSAVWGVATMKASIGSLVRSVDGLSVRIDKLEGDHTETRDRVARLEGAQNDD
ncbi:hypothetical protein N9878_01205 [bacterium]|nr:hypothetical protein [bacterium]